MAGLSTALLTVAFLGALLSWLGAAWSTIGIWRNRGTVSRLELAGSFLTAIRKLPPEAAPHVGRFWKAFAAFFLFIVLGVIATFTAPR